MENKSKIRYQVGNIAMKTKLTNIKYKEKNNEAREKQKITYNIKQQITR